MIVGPCAVSGPSLRTVAVHRTSDPRPVAVPTTEMSACPLPVWRTRAPRTSRARSSSVTAPEPGLKTAAGDGDSTVERSGVGGPEGGHADGGGRQQRGQPDPEQRTSGRFGPAAAVAPIVGRRFGVDQRSKVIDGDRLVDVIKDGRLSNRLVGAVPRCGDRGVPVDRRGPTRSRTRDGRTNGWRRGRPGRQGGTSGQRRGSAGPGVRHPPDRRGARGWSTSRGERSSQCWSDSDVVVVMVGADTWGAMVMPRRVGSGFRGR